MNDNVETNILDTIIPSLKEEILKGKTTQSIAGIFYAVLERKLKEVFNDSNYKFINYINIWNLAERTEEGGISIYATRCEGEDVCSITNNRESIKVDPSIFDKEKSIPVSVVFNKNQKYGARLCYKIHSNEDYVIATYSVDVHDRELESLDEKELEECCSAPLQKLLGNIGLDNKGKFLNWLRTLANAYKINGENDTTTQFYFFNGPIYFGEDKNEGELDQLLPKYIIYANVGIDDSCLKNDPEKKIIVGYFLRGFRKLIEQISFNLIVDMKNFQMRQTAVRAAIAQVMARNMSHNFGSHVLSNLIDDKVSENVKDVNVKKLNRFTSIQDVEEVFREGEEHQLQYFFQYLKSRMDYLSEVTLGVPSMLTSKMICGDVMKELEHVRILLNYISGVSTMKYRFAMKYNGVELTPQNDIGVSFPSDVIGCHAFYNILENIIRNTAKHAKGKNSEVVFTINFKDLEGCDGIDCPEELYCVEIDNGVEEENMKDLVKAQNERLNQSVLKHNQLRSCGLGLLEMEASAAFLRQMDLPEIESLNYDIDDNDVYWHERNGKKRLNVIKAFDAGGALGYRFFVQKSKEFLVVCEHQIEEGTNKLLLGCGIQFIKETDFENAMDTGKFFAHQFLLYDENVSDEVGKYLDSKHDCKTLLPLRKLPFNNTEWVEISKCWSDGEIDGTVILRNLKIWAWNKYYAQQDLKNCISIKGEFDCTTKKNQVVFKDHGDEESFVETCKCTRRQTSQSESWIENLSSRTYNKLPEYYTLSGLGQGEKPINKYMDYIRRGEWGNMIKQQIFEAYHNKVIVLDERVQKFSEENSEGSAQNGNKIPCWRLFRSTNVFIPRSPHFDESGKSVLLRDWVDEPLAQDSVFSLDPNDFDVAGQSKVKCFVKTHVDKDTLILVHYGVLERMYGGKEEKIKEVLNEWSASSKRVVVTSGRGAHSLNLPPSVCFVNLSSVLYACNENRNKYIVNYLLNQSRRKRDE